MKLLILCLFSTNLLAHDYHYREITVTQDQTTALGIAQGQHQFDWGTNNWQAGVAGGVFRDESAMSFGVAKRFDGALLNGSIGRIGSENGYGASINWRFK